MTEALSNHLLLADVRSHCFFPVLVSLYFFIIVMRCQITPFLPSLYWHHCITAHCQIPPFPLRTAVLFHQSSLLLDYCQVRTFPLSTTAAVPLSTTAAVPLSTTAAVPLYNPTLSVSNSEYFCTLHHLDYNPLLDFVR